MKRSLCVVPMAFVACEGDKTIEDFGGRPGWIDHTGAPAEDSAIEESEPEVEEDPYHPCRWMDEAHDVCCWSLRYESGEGTFAVVVDPEDGASETGVVELFLPADVTFDAYYVAGLGRVDGELYACEEVTLASVSIDSGDVVSTSAPCFAASQLRGETSWAPSGPVLLNTGDTGGMALTFYDTFLDAASGTSALEVEATEATSSSRFTVADELAYIAHHSADSVEVVSLPDGASVRSIPLEDYDTWIWGMSVVDGVLYLLDDGRAEGSSDVIRIVSFDVETGAQLGYTELGRRTEFQFWYGLECQAR